MTERDDIAFGTPEAELLGAAAFDGEPLSPPAGVKAALMARVSQSGKALPGEASRDEGGSRGAGRAEDAPCGADEDEVSRGAGSRRGSGSWVRRRPRRRGLRRGPGVDDARNVRRNQVQCPEPGIRLQPDVP